MMTTVLLLNADLGLIKYGGCLASAPITRRVPICTYLSTSHSVAHSFTHGEYSYISCVASQVSCICGGDIREADGDALRKGFLPMILCPRDSISFLFLVPCLVVSRDRLYWGPKAWFVHKTWYKPIGKFAQGKHLYNCPLGNFLG